MKSANRRELLLQFKGLFESQRQKLLFQQAEIQQYTLAPEELADEADLSAAELETSMRMRLRNREALFLKKVDEALRRIAEGRFGFCESCEEEIEEARLTARPTTTLCLPCKEESEHRERIHIDGHQPKSVGRRLKLA
jgi:DnaK suppressor protein